MTMTVPTATITAVEGYCGYPTKQQKNSLYTETKHPVNWLYYFANNVRVRC